MIRYYDSEIIQVSRRIDSLEAAQNAGSPSSTIRMRDGLVEVCSALENSRKY